MNFGTIESYVELVLERELGPNNDVGEVEIQQVINDVHKQFVGRTHLLHGSAHIKTESDVFRYPQPPKMLTPYRVTLNRNKLNVATVDDLDRINTDGTWYPNRFKVGTAVLTTGVGLDDITAGGIFTGTFPIVYTVTVDGAAASPETFKWAKDGTEQANTVNMSTSAITLDSGVTVLFAATTGHTDDDVWTFVASQTPSVSSNEWVND